MYLTGFQSLQDLKWYKEILPHFNEPNYQKNSVITDLSPVYLDSCLSGISGIWFFSAPLLVVPNFVLKIVHLKMINLVVAYRL